MLVSFSRVLGEMDESNRKKYIGMVVPKVRRILAVNTSDVGGRGEADLRISIATLRDERERLMHVVFKKADNKKTTDRFWLSRVQGCGAAP